MRAQTHPRDPVHLQGEGAPGQHQVRQDRGPPQEGRHHRHGHPSGRLKTPTFLLFPFQIFILEFFLPWICRIPVFGRRYKFCL